MRPRLLQLLLWIQFRIVSSNSRALKVHIATETETETRLNQEEENSAHDNDYSIVNDTPPLNDSTVNQPAPLLPAAPQSNWHIYHLHSVVPHARSLAPWAVAIHLLVEYIFSSFPFPATTFSHELVSKPPRSCCCSISRSLVAPLYSIHL